MPLPHCTLQPSSYNPLSLQPHEPGYGAGSSCPNVMLAYLKHMWITGHRQEAYSRSVSATRGVGDGDQASRSTMPP